MKQAKKLVLTNNPKVIEVMCMYPEFALITCGNDCEILLQKCMELVLKGWQFLVDPLGGYHYRPNPYHTMFLKKSETVHSSVYAYEMAVVDDMMKTCQRYSVFLKTHESAEHTEDYQAMDISIAMRSLQRLYQIP